ncbi:MAG: autotransporter outer membrane beta-barrel domain-containing protein [Rhodocyclaceae bacterium]|nr:autotransporter outer membrane beta-barrel domain-containing protein [Rhodocyclaceae bacterium]
MIKRLGYFLAGTALLTASGLASATGSTICAETLSSYYQSSCDASCQQGYRTSYPDCFTTSDSGSASLQIAGTSVRQVSSISSAIASRFLSPAATGPQQTAGLDSVKGMAAGNAAPAFNVWGNLNNTRSSYSGNSGLNNADKSNSDVTNTVVGLDYAFSPNMVIGLSAAYDRGNGSSGRNSVGSSTKGDTYAPYFGWQINKELAFDISTGWGSGKFSATGTKVDSDRSFTAANLSYNRWMNNLQLVGKVGYLTAEEKYGNIINAGGTQNNTSSTNTVDQFRLGVEAGYWMNGIMPFAGLAYTSDDRKSSSAVAGFVDNSKLGKDAFVLSLGANFFNLGKGVTGGILYTQESGRSNGKNDTLGANVSFRF